MKRLGNAMVLLAGLFPALASAQDASTPEALELYPTFEAVGARLVYTGDANANATARLEWRASTDAAWRRGVTMTRIRGSRWAGSVLWLTPNTNYDVRVVIDDPDGGATSVLATVRTRIEPPSAPSGRTIWVATNGADTNDGSSAAPLATLTAAMGKAAAGDEIRVRPGIYFQSLVTTKGGTAAAPIHLTADGPGTVIDGADPELRHRTDWRSDGGGIFSIPYTPAANRLVCADSLMRLYKQASVPDLQANANGVAQGFAIAGGRLYVKLEDGSDPAGHTMWIARTNIGLDLYHDYWHVSGFEIRHFGTAQGGSAFMVRGSHNWIADNFIHTLGGRAVFIRPQPGNDNLIERNQVFDPRIGGWPWSAVKGHEEEGPAISNRGGRGNVIRFNTVTGAFDGLDANDGITDENVATDADYYGNSMTGCGDDAIETDTISGINLRIWGNTFESSYYGISMAPIDQGPEYVLYNTFAGYTRGVFKFSLESSGEAWICHNSAFSGATGAHAVVWPTGHYSNMHFRNNVMVGNALAPVNDDGGESLTGNDFDGDLLHAVGYGAIFRWKGTNYPTIALLRAATGFEQAGRSGDPLFVSAAAGDFRLQPSSPGIDAALRLPGINDGFNGAAPDIGAIESGVSTPDATPPAPINDLR